MGTKMKLLNSLKTLNFNGAKKNLIQNYVPTCYCTRYISTSTLMKRIGRGLSKREIYKNKICGIVETNFRFEKVFLQVLGSGAYGSPQSLIVQSHYHRFLFNCGEGTRRIALDNKIECDYFTRLFVTSCSWDNVSGLPGFVIRENRVDEIMPVIRRICGPSGLVNFVDRFSSLFKDPPMSDHILELKSEEMNINDNFILKSVPIYPTVAQISPSNKSSKYVLAYICTFPSERGILSTSKLVSADVPPGPLVDDLRNGVTVTLQDGRIVTPLDVSIHNYKSSSFIVLEIPSVEYLESLISSFDFDKYKKEGTCNDPEENDLKIIVHFSPPEVMKDSRYRQWVNSFPPPVSHLVINSRSSCHGLPSPVKMQLQLNHIMPNIFPLFRNPGVPFVNSEEDMLDKEDSLNIPYTSEYQFDGPTVQSKSALQYSFRPFDEFESSNCPVVDPNQFLKDWEEEPILMNSLEELKTVVNNLNRKKISPHLDSYPKVLFLGTGASFGSNARNDSSILITAGPKSLIMLDCGRGTLNQLVRLMGKDETRSTLRHLKLIFISHIHQDHHFGLSAILTERRKAFLEAGIKSPPPLYILLPPDVFPVLQNIRHCFGLDIQNVVFMDNVKLTGNYNKNFYKYRTLTESLELERVTTAFVHHVRNSFGIALKHIDGWKIVYSGDCRPSKNLVDIGENCDLLIHEATFEDELLDEAEKNGHSTVSQAVKMGRNMNAKFTILTHFSQRYHTLPLLNEKVIKENVGITFDNMEVTFQDLPYLRHMYPTLKEIFYEDFQHSDAQRLRRVYFPDFKKPVFRKS
ncbi:UNVERIFIED_CONTAM: hypothetical protein RMT77_009627 [Armadillidium vulgare]